MTAAPELRVPEDPIAEAALIGCCIASHRGYLLASGRVAEGDFYNPKHQRLFRAAAGMSDLDGTDIDTRDQRIKQAAQTANVDSHTVGAILEAQCVQWDTNGHLARRVKRAAEARRLMAAAAETYNRLAAGEPAEVVLGDATPAIRRLLTGQPA